MKHPIQKIYTDEAGTDRFVANEIVRYILDFGGIDLNHLATKPFSKEDRQQFAQLIGYSLSGYSELSYVTDEAYELAHRAKEKETIAEEQVKYYEEKLAELRELFKEQIISYTP